VITPAVFTTCNEIQRLSITGKAGERPFSIIKYRSKFIYLTLQRPKYFEAISGSA
jgi:hypothetical protein